MKKQIFIFLILCLITQSYSQTLSVNTSSTYVIQLASLDKFYTTERKKI